MNKQQKITYSLVATIIALVAIISGWGLSTVLGNSANNSEDSNNETQAEVEIQQLELIPKVIAFSVTNPYEFERIEAYQATFDLPKDSQVEINEAGFLATSANENVSFTFVPAFEGFPEGIRSPELITEMENPTFGGTILRIENEFFESDVSTSYYYNVAPLSSDCDFLIDQEYAFCGGTSIGIDEVGAFDTACQVTNTDPDAVSFCDTIMTSISIIKTN